MHIGYAHIFFVVKDFIVGLVSFFLIENHGFLTYDHIIKLVLPYLQLIHFTNIPFSFEVC